ncbi:hypothetical protein L6164_006131 [Bauhinia variegata]|uniref:Uncharacterized protein n=1 Tax=Bauhinia variegata TaxID=167791 RepID=A0ACB9PTG0_BAUVA|nr:hypothetical protein L6164_006131 [Bauhinia variegata]
MMFDESLMGQEMTNNPINALVVPSPAPVGVPMIQTMGITKFGSFIETTSRLSCEPENQRLFVEGMKGIIDVINSKAFHLNIAGSSSNRIDVTFTTQVEAKTS